MPDVIFAGSRLAPLYDALTGSAMTCRDEVESGLAAQGFRVRDVREAPDRPGRQLVFITERTT